MKTTGPRICWHLGLDKTGTTTLQRHLFARHPEVYFLGKSAGPGRAYPAGRDPNVDQFHRLVLEPRSAGTDNARAKRLLDRVMDRVEPSHRAVVGSWEGVAQGARPHRIKVAEALRAVAPESRILLVLRNPIDHLPSKYLQDLRGTLLGKRPAPTGYACPRFPDLDTWVRLRIEEHDLPGSLDFANTVELYQQHFGKKHVRVQLFEDLCSNPRSFVEGVCDFFGVDAALGWELAQDRRSNERFTEAHWERVRRIQASRLRCWVFASLSPFRRRKQLGLTSKHPAFGARPLTLELSGETVRLVEAATAKGHRDLAGELGLGLAKYGYPL